jgi:hypothetical protein
MDTLSGRLINNKLIYSDVKNPVIARDIDDNAYNNTV